MRYDPDEQHLLAPGRIRGTLWRTFSGADGIRAGVLRAAKIFYEGRRLSKIQMQRYAKKLQRLRRCPIITQYLHRDVARVGGGYADTASGLHSTVGGGNGNKAGQDYATVGGGGLNTASGTSSTVSGGASNTAGSSAATVGGGSGNTASAVHATIAGGSNNSTSGDYSAIPGGRNAALTSTADYSFAFGRGVSLFSSYRAVFFDGTYSGGLGVNRDDFNGGLVGPFQVGTNSSNGYGAYLSNGGA